MIDHITISVTNADESNIFYSRILSELGYKQLSKDNTSYSYGSSEDNIIRFVITEIGKITEPIGQARSLHIAFKAPSEASVLAWYSLAIENGGKIITGPEKIDDEAFHALVSDPDGWRIEAIYRK